MVIPQQIRVFIDLKNQPDWQYDYMVYNGEIIEKDVPGNISYGFLGKAFSLTDTFLIKQAGKGQVKAGTSLPEWSGAPTYGDDPRDTARIIQGINIYNSMK